MFCPFQSKLRIKMSRSFSPLVCLFAALVSPSAISSEFSWPLEVKTHTQCVFKVPGMAMSGMNCVQDVQAIAELPAPYRQLATQLSELSATSKPEDFSALLGVQPRRVGRVHSFRTAQKEMRTQQIQWAIPNTIVSAPETHQETERALLVSYIDGLVTQVRIVAAPIWIYTINFSDTKCAMNCSNSAASRP